MTSLTLVGVTGRKRSGKDTFAERLVREHGYVRIGFADALKEMALRINPRVVTDGGMVMWLATVVEQLGWEQAKDQTEVRLFLQRLGTEGIRTEYPQFWIDAAAKRVSNAVMAGLAVVMPDTRFVNEAEYVVSMGGSVVRVNRPGLPEDGDSHKSEVEMDSFPIIHHVVMNDADILALHDKADELAAIAARRRRA